jgi:Tol biopolymer transport system component
MNELERLRRAHDAIDEPSREAVSTARELLLAEIAAGDPASANGDGRLRIERPPARKNRRRRRWGVLAIAAAIAVGVLLVTPAFGIGQRLLDLFQFDKPPEVSSPVWSPDGRRIAFERSRGRDSDLYVMNADGSGQRNLTRHTAHDFGPVWSPDGRRIAFGRGERRPGLPYDLYLMNSDGSGQRRLVRGGVGAAWSPDGRRIAFMSGSKYSAMSVSVMNADGNDHRVLARVGSSFSLAWAPDGKKIAFSSSKDTVGVPKGCSQVYVVNVDGTAERSLTQRPGRRTRWCYGSPAWSPDGRRIAVRRAPEADRYGVSHVYVMNADGSGQRRLTRLEEAVGHGGLAWSPDGRKIAFESEVAYLPDADGEIFVVNADGSGRRNLTRNPAHDFDPDWSPDARQILFVSNRDGRHDIYVMNADGSGQRRLTHRGV